MSDITLRPGVIGSRHLWQRFAEVRSSDPNTEGFSVAEAWNLGPDYSDCKSVRWIIDYLCRQAPGAHWQCRNTREAHEASALQVDSSKARSRRGWLPRWNLPTALDRTSAWQKAWRHDADVDMADFSLKQIQNHESAAERA